MKSNRKLKLYPDAVRNFNDRANNLLSKIGPIPTKLLCGIGSSFRPDSFVSGYIKENDIIGEMKLSIVDHIGKECAKIFKHNGKEIGLHSDNYKELVKLAKEIQRAETFYKTVSVTFVKTLLFEWMKEKYENKTTLLMTEFLIAKCEERLKELEIWIPIAMTYVQSEIKIGKVVIKSITKNMIDQWQKDCFNNINKDESKIEEHFKKIRKNLQGLAAVTATLFAEPLRAFEIAFAEAEKTISILRFYSPANFFPELCSYCTVLGKENTETIKYLVLENGKLLQINHEVCDKGALAWPINNDIISQMMIDGLDALSKLLARDNLTYFQKCLLDALMLYSRSSIAKNVNDKLVEKGSGLDIGQCYKRSKWRHL